MKFNRREDLARQCEGEDRKQWASAQYALYHKKKAELEQAAKAVSDELLTEIDKFTLAGTTQVKSNIAVVKLSALSKSSWAPETYILGSQKKAVKDIILRCQPDVDLMVAKLREVCETGKYRRSKVPSDVIVFHQDFIRQLEAVLSEADKD